MNTEVTIESSGITLNAPHTHSSGNQAVETGESASITTPTGQTVTIRDGIITKVTSIAEIDTKYFSKLNEQISNITNHDELSAFVNKVYPSIQNHITSLQSQLAALAPVVALASLNPADLPSLVTFAQNMITSVITPMIKPYLNGVAQLSQVTSQLSQLTSTIESVKTKVGSKLEIPLIQV